MQANWKHHKQFCTRRVEAAKLTPRELKQLDLLVSIRTHGTMELPHRDHPGTFPEAVEQRGRGCSLLGYGKEAAAARNKAWRKERRKQERARSQEEPSQRSSFELTPSQEAELEGVRVDLLGLHMQVVSRHT